MKNWITSALFLVGFMTLFVGGQGSMQLIESWRVETLDKGIQSHKSGRGVPQGEGHRGRVNPSSTAGAVAAKSTPQARSALAGIQQRVGELSQCLDKHDCFQYFQYDDGKLGYHYAVSKEVTAVASELEPLIENGELAIDPEVTSLVHQLLKFPEDHVRDVALRLVPYLPKSPETLKVTLEALGDSASAPLYSLGLKVMRGYADNVSDNQIFSEFLADKLLYGGPNISEEVAKNLFPLLNQNNIQLFQGVLTKLPERSPASSYLENGIKEYEIITAGY